MELKLYCDENSPFNFYCDQGFGLKFDMKRNQEKVLYWIKFIDSKSQINFNWKIPTGKWSRFERDP